MARGLIVVCGAAGALGDAVVAELASQGAAVVAVARQWPAASVPESSPAAAAAAYRLGADLTDPADVDRLWVAIDDLGWVAAMVNVVGGFRSGSVLATDVPTYRSTIDLNLSTAWWASRAAAGRLAQAGGGAIVNVASRAALQGGAGAAAYSVAKAGVVKLTEVMAGELAASHVRVNAILPGVIDTAANRAWMTAADLARAVPADAIARVIAFLVSDHAWPISGAAIPVYGWS